MPAHQRKSKHPKPERTGFVGVAGPSPFADGVLAKSIRKNLDELRREDEARAMRIQADREWVRRRMEEVRETASVGDQIRWREHEGRDGSI